MAESSCDQTKSVGIQFHQARFTADNLTKPQRAWLLKAQDGRLTCRYVGGWEAVTWRRMAKRMEQAQIVREGLHSSSEYDLTDFGRRVFDWLWEEAKPTSPAQAGKE